MDSKDVGIAIAIVVAIVVAVLLYYFVIEPAIYDIKLWWNIGNGIWFVIGLVIGLLIAFSASVYLASR